ncbi:MetQ/NlpA family ABC transporter substrate-binding protein [Cellulosilyticum ruminicola]|uniref:MetQ/NlpA family ABC transporter substrate-binding protein n=1 Tax=Cellulosilyticum ruminicola TaxID=425254 RepID=UPI0006CF9BA8|nr:MetQ/NlpA family ABC transporter substrate-binding protein [Cellulosilyticum ruminicola]
MKKSILLSAVSLLAFSLLTGCGAGAAPTTNDNQSVANEVKETGEDTNTVETGKIIVGASTSPHAEILEEAKPLLKEKGYDLEIKEFSDYVIPNTSLEDGALDANYFQHQPYLDDFNANKGTHLVSVAAIHYEPLGIYAGKSSDLAAIAEEAKIGVPNDTTNEARALLLLETQGIIKLDPNAGLAATKKDIIENPHNVDIVEIEAAQLVRNLQEVDFAVINGNYALQGGLNVNDALAKEESDSVAAQTYANVLVVREGDEGREDVKALVEVLQSKDIADFIDEKYQGSVVSMSK